MPLKQKCWVSWSSCYHQPLEHYQVCIILLLKTSPASPNFPDSHPADIYHVPAPDSDWIQTIFLTSGIITIFHGSKNSFNTQLEVLRPISMERCQIHYLMMEIIKNYSEGSLLYLEHYFYWVLWFNCSDESLFGLPSEKSGSISEAPQQYLGRKGNCNP